jgi:hypothetical protein
MAGITLAQAEQKITDLLAAEDKILNSQEYSYGSRSIMRAKLDAIAERIDYYKKLCEELTESTDGGTIHSQITIIDT